jgi:hypothetical protein
MRDEDLFSNDGTPPTASDHERGVGSDSSALSSAPTVPQDAPSSAYPPKTERRLTARHPLRLLLVAMAVVALVVLAGGYSVFRAVSPTPRQASSAFQQTRCPFPLGLGLVEGKDARCGFLVAPEDRSHLKGPTRKPYFFLFPGVGRGVHPVNNRCPYDITQAFRENPTEKPDASCISSMPEPFFT